MIYNPNHSIIVSFILMGLYLVTYIPARKRLKKHDTLWSLPFFINFAYVIYLVYFYQPSFLRKLGIDSNLLDISTIVMTIGAIIHHLSIILQKKFTQSKLLDLAHFQLSHILTFIPFSINSIAISLTLFQNFSGVVKVSLTITYAVVTLSLSTIGLLSGFKKLKPRW